MSIFDRGDSFSGCYFPDFVPVAKFFSCVGMVRYGPCWRGRLSFGNDLRMYESVYRFRRLITNEALILNVCEVLIGETAVNIFVTLYQICC